VRKRAPGCRPWGRINTFLQSFKNVFLAKIYTEICQKMRIILKKKNKETIEISAASGPTI